MALRLLIVGAAALVLAAPAAAAMQTHANACLKAHHVLVASKSPKAVTRFGVHVQLFESFSFHGVPAKVYDSGSLIFEVDAAAAVRAQSTLYSRLARYEIRLSKGSVSPYRIRLNLRRTEAVNANVVVIWDNYPQKAIAKSILHGCLS